ncbi:MAG: WhiB family transcriptional regulator [Acidimicrobiia bacterium]
MIPAAWLAPGDPPLSLIDALRLAAAPWRKDALCCEHPEVNFYPDRGQSGASAKVVCRDCLVKRECLLFAMSNRDAFEHGVWGGTIPSERRELLRRHQSPGLAPRTPPSVHCPGCDDILPPGRVGLCCDCSGEVTQLEWVRVRS